MAKRKPGQPTKYNKEIKRQLELLAKHGFSDVEMCEVIGINEQTLTNWKKRYPTFFGSLKDWKYKADRAVVRSLYQRATGYTFPAETIEVGGVTKIVTKHYAPDPTSMIFWLKNRQPDKWRDRKELKMDAVEGIESIIHALADKKDANK